MPNASEIVNNPEWFLHNIDLDRALLGFVKTDQRALSEASFLDARFRPEGGEQLVVPIADALTASQSLSAAAPRYIFHTAFCCSTLLARCLDLPGHTVALKEPEVLMVLSNYQRTRHRLLQNRADREAIFKLVNVLLFRPFADDAAVLVKPTNTVNNLIGSLLATHPQSRALLLHSDVQSFLVSLLKKGEEGRSFARNLFNIFALESAEVQQLSQNQLMRMTDLQIAAITWHLQLECYQDVLQGSHRQAVRSLHCDRLLAEPEDILGKLVDYFELPRLQENFSALMEHAPLATNSKTPEQSFSADDRKSEHRKTADLYADSFATILPWAEQLRFKHASVSELAQQL